MAFSIITTLAKKYFSFYFFSILIIISFFIFLKKLDINYYQCDEFQYLRKSKYFEFYRKRDFANPAWQENDAVDQAKLMEYIYWLPSFIIDGKTFEKLAIQESPVGKNYYDYNYWSSVYGKSFNLLELTPKLKEVVILARIISSFFTICYIALTVFLIFLIFHSYLLSIFAFVFLSFHPIILIHGRQILAESSLNFFLALSFLFLLFFWKNFWKGKKKQSLLFSLLAGIISGLAASTKLNGFMQSLFYILIILVTALLILFNKKEKKKLKKLKQLIFCSFVFLSLVFLVFYLIHPTIWKNPVLGVKRFIDWRLYITSFYQDVSSHESVRSIAKAFYLIFLRVPGYLIDVGSIGFIYENEFGSQNLWLYLVINSAFFVLGIIRFLYKLIREKNYYKTLEFFAFVWSLSIIVIVAFYLKLDWTRYYWPCFIPFLIIDFYGLKLFFRKKRKRDNKFSFRFL